MEDNILNIASKLLKDKKYGELFNIILWGFCIIAPSFFYIFLYKRELFYKLDTVKLILICIMLNIIIILCTYLYFYFLHIYKEYIILEDANKKIEEFNKYGHILRKRQEELDEISKANLNNISVEEQKRINDKLKHMIEEFNTNKKEEDYPNKLQNNLNEILYETVEYVRLAIVSMTFMMLLAYSCVKVENREKAKLYLIIIFIILVLLYSLYNLGKGIIRLNNRKIEIKKIIRYISRVCIILLYIFAMVLLVKKNFY